MGSEQALRDISRKLDVLTKLLAYQIVQEMKLAHGAPILRRLGMTVPEIADLYSTTRASVSVRLAETKRKARLRAKKVKG